MKGRFLRTFAFVLLMVFLGCQDNEPDSHPNGKLLIIKQGALNLTQGASQPMTASLVGVQGEEDVTSSVQWAENSDNASFQGNTLITGESNSPFKVTAVYTQGDNTFTASVPVNILVPSGLLAVVPAGILTFAGDVPLQLNTFFLGKGAVTGYEFSSSDATVASVDAQGLVTFNKAGDCLLTVKTIGVDPQQTMTVPIIILEPIGSEFDFLPVAKISLTPSSSIIFLNEKVQFEARAYDGKGQEVAPSGGFTWTVESLDNDPEDDEEIAVGTIIPNGNKCEFNGTGRYGRAKITAVASGISVHAEIFVSPEFILFINPPITSIAPQESKQFQIETYPVDKETMMLEQTPVANPPGIQWQFLDFGFSSFSIGTVDNTGNVTINQDAAPGMIGLLMADVGDIRYAPGFSQISVAIASDCECGSTLPAAISLDVNTNALSFTLSTGNTMASRPATVKNAQGEIIPEAQVNYCSSNEQAVSVSAEGTIIALSPGAATIKVCHGTLMKEINVTVSL